METKLYVGNLPYDTGEPELRELFSQAGEVTSVSVITDRASGRSKGFAFVEMGTQAEMEEAIRLFNGYTLENRQLNVNIARPREERGRGGGGGRGGYGDRGGRGGSRGGGGRGGSGRQGGYRSQGGPRDD